MTIDDKCPHCGSEEEPYFSRVVPMGYFCPDCGGGDEEEVDLLKGKEYKIMPESILVFIRVNRSIFH
jgi:Zn finger protein HypA/HybF involved in hydrogenase expression